MRNFFLTRLMVPNTHTWPRRQVWVLRLP